MHNSKISGVMYAPLVCRKCGKKRAERKEIITEIVETEEKYGRDLQIILEEFYQPMLVAGLLTQEQLSTIFLNVEELLENNQSLAERLRDALEIAVEQGDEVSSKSIINRTVYLFHRHTHESYTGGERNKKNGRIFTRDLFCVVNDIVSDDRFALYARLPKVKERGKTLSKVLSPVAKTHLLLDHTHL